MGERRLSLCYARHPNNGGLYLAVKLGKVSPSLPHSWGMPYPNRDARSQECK